MIYNPLKKRHFPTWQAIFVFFVVLLFSFAEHARLAHTFEKCESPIIGDFATNIP